MTTQYLYNINPKELIDMKYKQALEYKLFHAKELYHTMMLQKRNTSYNDDERSHYVWKAMIHTQKLLDELHDSKE